MLIKIFELLIFSRKWCAFIQSLVLSKWASASSSGFPENSGLKCDQFNCTNCCPCCAGCMGCCTCCVDCVGCCTCCVGAGWAGGVEVLEYLVFVVLLLPHFSYFNYTILCYIILYFIWLICFYLAFELISGISSLIFGIPDEPSCNVRQCLLFKLYCLKCLGIGVMYILY